MDQGKVKKFYHSGKSRNFVKVLKSRKNCQSINIKNIYAFTLPVRLIIVKQALSQSMITAIFELTIAISSFNLFVILNQT